MTALQDRQRELAGYLMAGFPSLGLRGWDVAGASVAGGNFTQENLCKPVTDGRHDQGSDGMGQWREGRLSGDGDHGQKWGMQPWCVKYMGGWETIKAQAAFTLYEAARDLPALDAELRLPMAGVKPANLRAVLDYKTKMFMDEYERPNAALAGLANRQSHAAAIYAMMTSGQVPVVPPAPAKPIVPPVVAGTGAVVIAAPAAGAGILMLANGELTTMSAVVISVILLTVAIGVPLLIRPRSAKPVPPPPALAPMEKLAAALELRAAANAQVAEAADEVRESLHKTNDLLTAAGILVIPK